MAFSDRPESSACNKPPPNGRSAAMGQTVGALGSLAMAGAKYFSDRRLKTNIRTIGSLPNGLPIYTFSYIWGGPEQVGLMSDDVRRLHPHAVVEVGGFDAVDYAEAVREVSHV
jgi:hypothetical protein